MLLASGIAFDVAVSGVDEETTSATSTVEIVAELAERKARAVAPLARDALVIGCDSLLELDGESIGKPLLPEAAAGLWRRLRGRRASLRTGQVLLDARSGELRVGVVSSTIEFATPGEEEIEAYVKSGEPLELAGGFTIDGRGSAFVRRVEGDPNAVLGLSTALLRSQLRELGGDLTAYWGAEEPSVLVDHDVDDRRGP